MEGTKYNLSTHAQDTTDMYTTCYGQSKGKECLRGFICPRLKL